MELRYFLEMDTNIDFVVSWVDSNDVEWQKRMNTQLKKMGKDQLMIGEERYHDFGFFKYWFRAVEKYAPWVNHVYLVTDQQVPSFFRLNNNVTIVDHTDFIPEEYLPTFSSSVIELFLDRIPGLSEKFVYFNDDMLLNAPVSKNDFFSEDGLPMDSAIPSVLQPASQFDYITFNDALVLNQNFPKRIFFKKYMNKFLNYKYGLSNNLKTMLTIPFTNWSSFKIQHIPYSLRRKDYFMMRNYANEQIDRTARMHFRSDKDINIWLLLELRFVQGDFVPRKTKIGKYYDFDDGKALIKTLKSGKVPLICINDDSKNKKLRDKIKISEEILKVLEEKFSSRSSVEI
ncbi:sugar phosphotransferase [Pediococcus acidilactici]|nr:sugar phosphotransferase [Pediococcus acidilactici]KAF0378350.1 sugar phosphotransferase [Pediococcus acidilactici]KAF0388302.1 sugar phosphotransferase [Pediococcus acidilactici]KAF0451468.1 sugar phosphotransferase [Pediococcus acidilactici]KAF0460777.1 sugar phosphotransferase [Pediococcus acidilactici]